LSELKEHSKFVVKNYGRPLWATHFAKLKDGSFEFIFQSNGMWWYDHYEYGIMKAHFVDMVEVDIE